MYRYPEHFWLQTSTWHQVLFQRVFSMVPLTTASLASNTYSTSGIPSPKREKSNFSSPKRVLPAWNLIYLVLCASSYLWYVFNITSLICPFLVDFWLHKMSGLLPSIKHDQESGPNLLIFSLHNVFMRSVAFSHGLCNLPKYE